jgi:hypothetical protein
MEVNGQLEAAVALPLSITQSLRYPVNTRLGGLQTLYGYSEERKIPNTMPHESNPQSSLYTY